jgi:hypothetical protein
MSEADVILAAFGATLAAFAIWLPVRIVNRGERWAKWTAAAVVALILLYWMLTLGNTERAMT